MTDLYSFLLAAFIATLAWNWKIQDADKKKFPYPKMRYKTDWHTMNFESGKPITTPILYCKPSSATGTQESGIYHFGAYANEPYNAGVSGETIDQWCEDIPGKSISWLAWMSPGILSAMSITGFASSAIWRREETKDVIRHVSLPMFFGLAVVVSNYVLYKYFNEVDGAQFDISDHAMSYWAATTIALMYLLKHLYEWSRQPRDRSRIFEVVLSAIVLFVVVWILWEPSTQTFEMFHTELESWNALVYTTAVVGIVGSGVPMLQKAAFKYTEWWKRDEDAKHENIRTI